MSPREIRRLQRIRVGREQILDAAEELFGRHGYRGTSLQQVAKRCEFSIGALYLFIDSKEELLRGVLERRSVALMAEMRACVQTDGPAHEVLVKLARTQVAFHRRYPDFGRLSMRIMTAGIEAVPGLDEAVARGYARAIDVETDLFERGQADGTIRAGDPRGLARMFSAMVSAYHALDPAVTDGEDNLDGEVFIDTVAHAFASS